MKFAEGIFNFKPKKLRSDAEPELDFSGGGRREEEKEEPFDPAAQHEEELQARRQADTIFEQEEIEAGIAAAQAREEAERAEEQRLIDEVYNDTGEDKRADLGPQRDRAAWENYYKEKKG